MLSICYRASKVGIQPLLLKTVSKQSYKGRVLFHTCPILKAADITTDVGSQDLWNISETETDFVLNKFNTSLAFELMKIKYISQPLANTIVAHRDEKGKFKKVEDLLQIPKIGKKKLHSIIQSTLSQSETSPIANAISVACEYAPDEEQTILHTLNTFTQHELSTINSIGKVTSKKIVEYRTVNGPFDTLDSVLEMPRIGQKKFGMMCRSILDPIISKKAPPDKEYIHDLVKLQSVQDLVTINIGLKDIAWLHMSKDRHVLQWVVHNIDTINPSKWVPHQYFSTVRDIVNQLPVIDLYLLEHQVSFGQSKKEVYHIYTFIRSLEALFLGIINADTSNCVNLGAVSVPSSVVGRHFDLMIGMNRATGQEIVKMMLKEQWRRSGASMVANEVLQTQYDDTDSHGFTINENVAQAFHAANHFQKELMANALLQALTFYNKIGQYE